MTLPRAGWVSLLRGLSSVFDLQFNRPKGELMLMRIATVTVVAIATFVPVAKSQSDLLPSTKLMREQAQTLYRGLNPMVKGEAAFDAVKADEHFASLIATATRLPQAFPQSSKGKVSPNTRNAASPKVWESRADFEAHASALLKVLQENRAKAKSLDGLKAAYPAINNACDSCHNTYRMRIR